MSRIAAVLLLLVATAAPLRAQQQPERPRNVILFISDGCGPASFTLARDYQRDHLRAGDRLALDEILVGAVRTHSSDSRVTDSAAGATALAAGVKTYNGAIGVDDARRPVETVLEAARARGLATGLVATSRITHATPASFAAHVPDRGMESEIAAQQSAAGVDVLFGGGRRFFVPPDDGGVREDGRDLLAEMEANGYAVASTRAAFERLDRTPAVALLAMDHLAYEIDRDSLAEPSLAELTARAIDLLGRDPDGFFLMVEGSRIDHAGHENDAAAHLHDLLAYDRAVAVALAYARRDGQTLVVSTSDHETGGLTLGRGYEWEPAALAAVRQSFDVLIPALRAGTQPPQAVLREAAGITDLSADELAQLQRAVAGEAAFNPILGEIVASRARIDWASDEHTAVDVNLYAFGPGSERLHGNHENTIVGQVIGELIRR